MLGLVAHFHNDCIESQYGHCDPQSQPFLFESGIDSREVIMFVFHFVCRSIVSQCSTNGKIQEAKRVKVKVGYVQDLFDNWKLKGKIMSSHWTA